MKVSLYSLSGLALALLFSKKVRGEVYYEEDFSAKDSVDKWVKTGTREDVGKIERSPGKWFSDEEASQGLRLTEDYRFYQYTTKLDKPFSNKGKDLVVQFTVKYEQEIDCGGAYLKLLPPTLDPKEFNGDSKYGIMFGPDICGSEKRMVHAILNHKDKNVDMKPQVHARTDQLTHQYTLWLKKNKTFELIIDNQVQKNGTIEDFWNVALPKTILDENDKKPEDWVDEKEIYDPEDKKPEDWVDEPEQIADPEATKPEDWDDELDGDWEPSMIPNPKFKVWEQRRIPNPDYIGEWKQKTIPNPDYVEDKSLAVYDIGYIGLDIWTVKSGTIFDNILLTDDIEYARKFGEEKWSDHVSKEIEVKKAIDEEQKKKNEEMMAKMQKEHEEEMKKKEQEEKEKEETKEGEKEEKKDGEAASEHDLDDDLEKDVAKEAKKLVDESEQPKAEKEEEKEGDKVDAEKEKEQEKKEEKKEEEEKEEKKEVKKEKKEKKEEEKEVEDEEKEEKKEVKKEKKEEEEKEETKEEEKEEKKEESVSPSDKVEVETDAETEVEADAEVETEAEESKKSADKDEL